MRIEIENEKINQISGTLDSNFRLIEKNLNVDLINRDSKLIIDGENAKKANDLIEKLLHKVNIGETIDEQVINYLIENSDIDLKSLDSSLICTTISGKPIKAKTKGQMEYINNIKNNMVVFGTGPAGTGKTFLAMAMAITAFKRDEVSRIILTRPAIEAGERLGFLPGDLQQKVDPYLRPLYDALYQIMGAESFQKNMEKGLIEVAPLAYMRGRTLDNAFIILDEAQNTTTAQMKMFLTRLGFGSKAIITGDLTQKDLNENVYSGLDHALKVLKNVEGIGFSNLTNADVVRHPLVMKIVKAYDDFENKKRKKDVKFRNRG